MTARTAKINYDRYSEYLRLLFTLEDTLNLNAHSRLPKLGELYDDMGNANKIEYDDTRVATIIERRNTEIMTAVEARYPHIATKVRALLYPSR